MAQMKTLSVLKMERIAGASFKNGANVIWCDIANIANVIWCDINKISVCHAKYKTISLQTLAGVEMKYRLAIQDLFRVVV